jgi:hypothetical protein
MTCQSSKGSAAGCPCSRCGIVQGRSGPVKAVCDRRATAPVELPGKRTREDGLDRTCPDQEMAAIRSRDTSGSACPQERLEPVLECDEYALPSKLPVPSSPTRYALIARMGFGVLPRIEHASNDLCRLLGCGALPSFVLNSPYCLVNLSSNTVCPTGQ